MRHKAYFGKLVFECNNKVVPLSNVHTQPLIEGRAMMSSESADTKVVSAFPNVHKEYGVKLTEPVCILPHFDQAFICRKFSTFTPRRRMQSLTTRCGTRLTNQNEHFCLVRSDVRVLKEEGGIWS